MYFPKKKKPDDIPKSNKLIFLKLFKHEVRFDFNCYKQNTSRICDKCACIFLDAMLCLTGDHFYLVVLLQVLPNWVNLITFRILEFILLREEPPTLF